MTGLSGAGKTTLAAAAKEELTSRGVRNIEIIDEAEVVPQRSTTF